MVIGENNLTNLSDEKLVEKICRKDSELYTEIVRRYQQKLYRYLRYLTNQPDAAEDLVQNVFIKAYRNLFGFNSKKNFSSWIYRIAHNEGLNHIKKVARKKSISWKNTNTPVPSQDNSLTDELIQKETQKKLQKCLNELKPKYRKPLVLHYFEPRFGNLLTRLSR